MSEAERQLKVARQAIEVALDWLQKADQSLRGESHKTKLPTTRPATTREEWLARNGGES